MVAPVFLILAALAGNAGAAVAPPTGASPELLTNETRRTVTEEVKKFLEERCAQQCDLGEVTVKVEPRKPPVGATPGFEEQLPDVKDYIVSRVDVNLMLDKRLPNDFRSGIRTIIAKKLEAEGISNAIHEALIHFPTPQELPERQPLAPNAPQPAKEKPGEKAPSSSLDPSAPIAQLPVHDWRAQLIESLPLLLGLLLCATVVWFTLRQYQKIIEARTDVLRDREAAAEKKSMVADPKAAATDARREVDRSAETLRAKLEGNRPLTRAVMRDVLTTGQAEETALAVAMLGPTLLDGLRSDPECRAGLRAVDDFLSSRAPGDTVDARRRVIADLDRRVLRVQVARGEQPEESPFAFLRDASTTLVARLLADEPAEVQAIILRQAPPVLAQSFIESLPPTVREQLVGPLLSTAAASRDEVSALATAFRDKLARHQILEREGHADPVGDLLQAASTAERSRLLASLRNDPPALRRALASFVDEETLGAIDAEVIAAAIVRLDTTTAALFVGTLDEIARKRLLAALPEVTARSIAEEADVLVAAPLRRAAARRLALATIKAAVDERGLDLSDINRRVINSKQGAAS